MKLLYCSARPFLPFGYFYGSTRTAATLLGELSGKGVECQAVGLIPWKAWRGDPGFPDHAFPSVAGIGPLFHYRLGLIEAAIARSREHYLAYLEALLADEACRPDVLWSELELSDAAIELARNAGVRTALWLKDLDYSFKHAPSAARRADVLLCASRYMRGEIRKRLGRDAAIVPEAVWTANAAGNPAERTCVTIVNPVRAKGGDVFLKLAALLPHRRFLAVPGWTAKAFPGRPPRNVEVLAPQADMSRVWDRTAVLLVPSRWQEAFGRVAAEAMASGIPVVASRSGGLPETIGRGGRFVDEVDDLGAWTSTVERLMRDEPLRRRLARLGKRQAARFGAPAAASRLLAALRTRRP